MLCTRQYSFPPADEATREHADHERDGHKAAPRGDVREVRDPQLIGTLGVKLPLHQILHEFRRGVSDRRAMTLPAHAAAHAAAQALGGHESRDGAARYRLSITQQLLPHFTHAVHAAKNALALRRMSDARVSSRFTRSSVARRSASVLVGPDGAPASCSALKSHRRNASIVQPNFGAIAEMAAHWDGWCGNCSRTKRTARSRTSGRNRCARDFAMTPSSHKVEPPVIPGRVRRGGIGASRRPGRPPRTCQL